jgi:electron transfer flavoprotein alpha subunit
MQNLQENSKVAFELASCAKKVAESLGTTVTAITIKIVEIWVDKVLKVKMIN